eukprot:CAMPEP_0197394658 /NCGR_PEP_ID=MMETSP1165-20131217/5708_1 /TAXON_ID=284809 /ORGANISM="Chrysocystis fragilis, Strain CCMP3189" /LENGTH=440 /DNA_ID=CAMNT_0042920383 /DNA_START=29 /DNA_END=1351 /DNA_ORIENTATION=+
MSVVVVSRGRRWWWGAVALAACASGLATHSHPARCRADAVETTRVVAARPEQRQQAQQHKAVWGAARHWLRASALAVLTMSASANAENELSALGERGFDASLIDTECVTGRCRQPAQACLDSTDCRKGMTCTAKCLGDNACITGCFAKYGNEEMISFLDCTVEKNGCVKIAILPPGPYTEAPPPPVTPIEAFDPASLQGTWYKVLGWNSRYDCFDCQMNAFAKTSKKDRMQVSVDLAMPRPGRRNQEATSYPLSLSEEMDFDFVFENGKLVRHASTRGHMFGLTFWENWSVLGQNRPGDPDEWKFVYYTGKTTQNTYEGAFVYSRSPELAETARKDVYALATRAGIDPNSFCLIRNDRATCDAAGPSGAPVLTKLQRGLFVGAATAAEGPDDFQPPAPRSPLDSILDDLSDYLEDPHRTATWLFNQQVKVPRNFFPPPDN